MKPDAPRTEEGVILGTVAYMSPEQAEAKKVDARSDIFSFGAILYEMLTGRRAFQGDSKISTLSAILHQEPKPIREVVDGVPPHLEWIVSHCLRKDSGRRFQGMADLKVALEEVKEDSDSGRLFVSPRQRVSSSPRLLIASIVCVVVVAAVSLAWWLRRSPGPAAGPVLTRLTADSGLTTDPVLSPDGKLVAYASDRSREGSLDIWVQQVAGGDPIRLTRDPADKSEPAFSPDGSKIAFRSERDGGGIYVSSALGGGEPRLLVPHGRRPRFSPDGSQIAYWVGASPWAGKIYVLPSTGGTPRQFQPEFNAAAYPVWSPDGKHLLFLGWLSSKGSVEQRVDWWSGPVDSGAAIQSRAYAAIRRQFRLLQREITVIPPDQWLADPDRVIFAAELDDRTNLWQIRLDSRTRTSQSLQQLTFGTGHDVQPSVASPRLVFSSQLKDQNIWLLPIQANQGTGSGEIQRATRGAAINSFPSLSADGRKLAYASLQSGRVSIWTQDLESGRRAALTASSHNEEFPLITPDGSKAAYWVATGEKRPIYVAAMGGGSVERVCEDCGAPWSWSSDGGKLFYYWVAFRRMGWIDLGSHQKTEFRQPAQSLLVGPRIGPDDRWIAFGVRNGPNRQQLAIAEFRGGAMPAESEWIPVTDDAHWAADPCWSPDGRILYFTYDQDGSRCIWAQRLGAGKRPLGPPVEVKHFHSAKITLGFGLSVAHDKLVFSMGETTGNIWMAKLDASR